MFFIHYLRRYREEQNPTAFRRGENEKIKKVYSCKVYFYS